MLIKRVNATDIIAITIRFAIIKKRSILWYVKLYNIVVRQVIQRCHGLHPSQISHQASTKTKKKGQKDNELLTLSLNYTQKMQTALNVSSE